MIKRRDFNLGAAATLGLGNEAPYPHWEKPRRSTKMAYMFKIGFCNPFMEIGEDQAEAKRSRQTFGSYVRATRLSLLPRDARS